MITEKTNIQYFNEVTALALGHLYESFPMSEDLYLHNLTTEMDDASEGGESGCPLDIVVETLNRLCDFGLVTGKCEAAGFLDACLTIQGLQTLNSLPRSFPSKMALGKHLRTAVNNYEGVALETLGAEALSIATSFTSGVATQKADAGTQS